MHTVTWVLMRNDENFDFEAIYVPTKWVLSIFSQELVRILEIHTEHG